MYYPLPGNKYSKPGAFNDPDMFEETDTSLMPSYNSSTRGEVEADRDDEESDTVFDRHDVDITNDMMVS